MFSLDWLVPLPRWQKRVISVATDFISLVLISLIAVWLRLGEVDIPQQFEISRLN